MTSGPPAAAEEPSLDKTAAELADAVIMGDSRATWAATVGLVGLVAATLRDLQPPDNAWTVVGYYDGGHPVTVAAVAGHVDVAGPERTIDDCEVFRRHVFAADPAAAVAAVQGMGR